ncbi:MAG: hypothetical protein ACK4YP_03800 [Myxococcota bacterium]
MLLAVLIACMSKNEPVDAPSNQAPTPRGLISECGRVVSIEDGPWRVEYDDTSEDVNGFQSAGRTFAVGVSDTSYAEVHEIPAGRFLAHNIAWNVEVAKRTGDLEAACTPQAPCKRATLTDFKEYRMPTKDAVVADPCLAKGSCEPVDVGADKYHRAGTYTIKATEHPPSGPAVVHEGYYEVGPADEGKWVETVYRSGTTGCLPWPNDGDSDDDAAPRVTWEIRWFGEALKDVTVEQRYTVTPG